MFHNNLKLLMKENKYSNKIYSCPESKCQYKSKDHSELLLHLEFSCVHFREDKNTCLELSLFYKKNKIALIKNKPPLGLLIFNKKEIPMGLLISLEKEKEEDLVFIQETPVISKIQLFLKQHEQNKKTYTQFTLMNKFTFPEDTIDYTESLLKSGILTCISSNQISLNKDFKYNKLLSQKSLRNVNMFSSNKGKN